MKGGMERKGR